MPATDQAPLRAEHLTLAYGDRVIQRDLTFTVNRGDIFIVMGGSGCGKSTLLRHLIGLQRPAAGRVFYGPTDYWSAQPPDRAAILRRIGVLYQGGALFSSMTLAENVAVPLESCTPLPPRDIRALAERKLALYLSSLGGGSVRLPLSICALSELLDIGRASLYRAFDRLEADGYITRQGRTVTVNDPKTLLNAYL